MTPGMSIQASAPGAPIRRKCSSLPGSSRPMGRITKRSIAGLGGSGLGNEDGGGRRQQHDGGYVAAKLEFHGGASWRSMDDATVGGRAGPNCRSPTAGHVGGSQYGGQAVAG